MDMSNHINPLDDVRVEIYEDGKKVDTYQGSGFHTLDEAVTNAYEGSRQRNGIEDYIFTVENLSTGTSARYRIDAGGHLRIIPEL